MFSWSIGSSLRFRFLVLAAIAALLLFGTQQPRKVRLDVFPEFAPPKAEIQNERAGVTSTEIGELITLPMEDQLRSVAGVESVRSSSLVALSRIVLPFKMGTHLMESRQRVQERLKLAIPFRGRSSYRLMKRSDAFVHVRSWREICLGCEIFLWAWNQNDPGINKK
jgi:Cu/Ag efflux pump CusA